MAASRPNTELTSTERECLQHYRTHLTKYGVPPSLRQLGAYLGVHFNAAKHSLNSLIKKGFLEVVVHPVTSRRLKAPEKKP